MSEPSPAPTPASLPLLSLLGNRQFLTHLLTLVLAILGAQNLPALKLQSPICPVSPPGAAPAPVPPSVPPATIPSPLPPAAAPRLDPLAAIGRIQFGNAGCTATIIGPRREDGRWWVLTAAHCVRHQPANGNMKLRDGRSFGLKRIAVDPVSDCCWCVTVGAPAQLPFTFVQKTNPASGTRVWHAGFGVDKPGNREDGTIIDGPTSDGQMRMRLSVSSGDSGGGIINAETGELISCVCCTISTVRDGWTQGACPEAINKLLPTAEVYDDFTPIDLPKWVPATE